MCFSSFFILVFLVASTRTAKIEVDPLHLLQKEGPIWKNLKYQPVSAFWSKKPGFYFAIQPMFVFPNALSKRCGEKFSCLCYEAVNVDRFLSTSRCPEGFASVCFRVNKGVMEVHVPGNAADLETKEGLPPLTPFNIPHALELHLNGEDITLIHGYSSVGVPMPMFKYFYGYREHSDVPEPIVRLSTAGCQSGLRLFGFAHGTIYSQPFSKRRKKNI